MTSPTTGSCPVSPGTRKLSRSGDVLTPGLEHRVGARGERWVVRDHEVARRLIRAEDSVRQAGFGADPGPGTASPDPAPRRRPRLLAIRPPILYLEGAEHRQQRKATARHFAPKVTESYRSLMTELSDQLVTPLERGATVDLPSLSLKMAVQVAGQVVGLTNSSLNGMSRRLDAFFAGDVTNRSLTPANVPRLLRTQTALLRFYLFDVRPAIRARRRAPQSDVISQLLEIGYSPLEILTECVTYGAAGMATTREFITVAAWHLLDDPDLLVRYRAGDLEDRTTILHEILRLEPVVGHLFRRTTAAVSVTVAGVDRELPAGTLIDFDIRAINADAALVGADPLDVVPSRSLERGVARSVLSFGDGNHRCPGAPIAIMESEIMLTRLFALDLVADHPPTVTWNATTEGYELRRFEVRRR
ncbi:MAG: cytochrome P450 [Propionibacteriaceae bacterium]